MINCVIGAIIGALIGWNISLTMRIRSLEEDTTKLSKRYWDLLTRYWELKVNNIK